MSVDMTDFMDTMENGSQIEKAAARRILQLSDELAQAKTSNLELVLERNSLRDENAKLREREKALFAEREMLRAALLKIGRSVGGILSDEVSSEFLCLVPVDLFIAKVKA